MTAMPDQPARRPRCTTAECVSDGHPDKICDQIADAVLDACLREDPDSHVAVEVAFKGHDLTVLGEVTSAARVDVAGIARGVLTRLGHDGGRWGLDLGRLTVHERLSRQSPEIAHKVAGEKGLLGAGDQGITFGYACDETPERMPLAYSLARALMLRQRELRGTPEGSVLGPDAKSQVTVAVNGAAAPVITAVVVSSQHDADTPLERVRELLVEEVIRRVIPAALLDGAKLIPNPGGAFTEGGPVADAGVTGRKIIADSYGPFAHHGGGAFSGKDGTKVDRSGAYGARRLARAVVDAGLARRAEIHAAYAIGAVEPVDVDLETFGTGVRPDAELLDRLDGRLRSELSPSRLVETLGLRKPVFSPVAAFGHFGRPDLDLPWEQPLALDA